MKTCPSRSPFTGHQKAGLAACLILALAGLGTFSLTGCGTFFIKGDTGTTGSTSSTGTSGSTGTTGSLYSSDYIYTSDPTTNTQQINAYTVASGALSGIASTPLTLNYAPVSMVVTPNDSLLFASDGDNIYAYTVNSSGSLSLLQNGPVFSNEPVTSLAISPNGNYLFALSPTNGEVLEFLITYGTGLLTSAGNGEVALPTYNGTLLETPTQVRMCPSGECIVAALGNVGIAIAALNQGTGAVGNFVAESPTNSSADAVYDVAIDSNNYIYMPQTNGLYVYSYNNGSGAVGLVSSTPYALGTGPYSVVVSNSSQYVYVANRGNTNTAATISGFTIGSSGALTSVGAVVSAPTYTSALSMDSTGQYLIALGYDSTSGLALYSVGTGGVLTSKAVQPSGNNTSGSVAIIASVH